MNCKPHLTHFIGFRDDRSHAAVRVFGEPDFFHLGYDRRAHAAGGAA